MERALKCDLCSEDFISQSERNHHMAREHGNPMKTFVCSMCDHAFGSKHYLIEHMRAHTGERPFKCSKDDCEMTFKRQSALKDHIKWKHSDERPFKCHFPSCRFAAKIATTLVRHKKVHSDDRPFACSECDYKTNWNSNLKLHRIRLHSAGGDFKCSDTECSISFKSSADLKSHCSNQHEERNVSCDHPGCDKKYANASALKVHKRSIHSMKSLVCPNLSCLYRTSHSRNFARHMIVHNVGNEKISCSLEGCQYKGKNKIALERHMRLHNTFLQCPESGCGHYSSSKETFKHHLKLHDHSGRPLKCLLCFQHFQQMSHLQQHCVVHTNEKAFACGHCDYAAARRSSVKQHISSAHANVKFPFIVHLLDDRECLDCNVTLPTAEQSG